MNRSSRATVSGIIISCRTVDLIIPLPLLSPLVVLLFSSVNNILTATAMFVATTMPFFLATTLALFSLGAVLALSDIEHPHETLTTLAFGSCHKRKYVNPSSAPTIWDTIQKKEEPDAFVWTGDSVYPPTRGVAPIAMLQEEYRQMQHNASLGYANFHPPMGIYGTYDDHDYGGNDLGVEIPHKEERAFAFLQFIDKPFLFQKDGRHGIYSSVEWGLAPQKIKVLLLDTRWHREPHCIPSVAHALPMGAAISCVTRWLTAGLLLPTFWKRCQEPRTILGEEQWAWLESQLSDSDAQVHVIVSSIQVLTSNPVMESWGHYPEERQRLLKLVNGKAGAVLLSGDVHHAEILSPQVRNKTTLLEVTSSGMTHTCATPSYGRVLCKPLLETFDAHRYKSRDNFYIGKNYGTLKVDWEKKSFEVLVHDHAGSVVLRTGSMPFEQDAMTEAEIEEITPVNDGHLIPKFRKFFIAMITLVTCWLIQRVLRKR